MMREEVEKISQFITATVHLQTFLLQSVQTNDIMATVPAWQTARKKRCFEQFIKLKCVKNQNENLDSNAADFDVSKLDQVKMKAHILDCVAALGVVQQEIVSQKLPLVLNEGEQPLSAQAQLISNTVFTNVAMSVLLTTLTSEGEEEPKRSTSVLELLSAFPDESKLTDGRGWLPLHWAAISDCLEVADMKVLYASDPLALQRYHQAGTDKDDMGFSPAHLLCMQEMTNRNMSLIQHFSICNQRAFTMSASYPNRGDPLLYGFTALHASSNYGQPTEELIKHLLQLDSSQTKKKCGKNGLTPLGYLCKCSTGSSNGRLVTCLLEVDSSTEVVGNGIRGCIESTDHDYVLEKVKMLLKANPEAAKYHDSIGENLLHCAADRRKISFQLCIDIMQQILSIHKEAVREVDSIGRLPVHNAARDSTEEVMEFLLGLYPESASIVFTLVSFNHLHLAVIDTESTTSVMEAKFRFLCSRYPALMLQRDCSGFTPLHAAIVWKITPAVRILCEAGGQEQVKTTVADPTDDNNRYNGWLPLHYLIDRQADSLRDSLFSDEAGCFRMLLRMYPEAAGIEGGVGVAYKKTPYQLGVGRNLPPYYLRLLLRAAPDLNPAELHRLNYAERRMAMFLAFGARARATEPPLLARLRFAKMDLVKHVISFL